MFRSLFKKLNNSVPSIAETSEVANHGLVEVIKQSTQRQLLTRTLTYSEPLNQEVSFSIQSAEFDNPGMKLYINSEIGTIESLTLQQIPMPCYDTKIFEEFTPSKCILKIIAPGISAQYHPECMHIIKLEFTGRLQKLEKLLQTETIDLMRDGEYFTTIEREYHCIKVNDIPLDKLLSESKDIPNVANILDYYKNVYSKPKEWQVSNQAIRFYMEKP